MKSRGGRGSVPFGQLFLLLVVARLASVQANMRAPAFGKLRWGQDNVQIFLTAYIPGVDVHDDVPEVTVNNSHFKLEAADPATNEVYTIEFEFREDVNASGMVQRHSTWKYGNANNSMFVVIPKLEPGHLFDRLYAQKHNKRLKFAIEKDWDRYTVSDDMMEDEEEAEDEDEDSDIVKLTDANLDAKTKGKEISLVRVYYPWCDKCKKHDAFEKAATSKRGKRVAKKHGILFGTVNARDERKTRRTVSARCKKTPEDESATCTDYLYFKNKGDEELRPWPHTTFSIAEVLKMVGPSPRSLSTKAELVALQKDSDEKNVVVGFFDKSKHPEAAEAYEALAQAHRSDYLFAMMDESRLVGSTVNDMIQNLIGSDCAPAVQAPAMLVLRNFSTNPVDDGFVAFGAFAGDEFMNDDLEEFIRSFNTDSSKVTRHNAGAAPKPVDEPSKRTVVRLFVGDQAQAQSHLDNFRCAMRIMHREATFVYHDEKHETGKPVVGANMSEATKIALLDYGLGGQPRPLLVVDHLTDGGVKHYVLRMEVSPNYLVKQVGRAIAGMIPEAVRSEPVPAQKIAVGKVNTVVGSNLAETLGSADVLLQMLHEHTGHHQLPLLEGDKVAKALEHVGSNVLVASMNFKSNHCNKTDPRIPSSLKCDGPTVVFIPQGGEPVAFDNVVNARASPALQFVHDHALKKFDVVKAQEHVKELDALCTVTLHQHGSRNGDSAVFRIGRYNLEEMVAAGAQNDGVSSLTVDEGCQATLYENGDFSGWNATFEPGQYIDSVMIAGGAKNDETSSLVVSKHVPLNPPVQSGVPEATINEAGDITVTWPINEPEEGVAKAANYAVYSTLVKDATGAIQENQHPVLRAGGLAAAAGTTQTWELKFQEGLFESGTEVQFQVKPSAKVGPGQLSEPSNTVTIPTPKKPEDSKAEEDAATPTTKDEV